MTCGELSSVGDRNSRISSKDEHLDATEHVEYFNGIEKVLSSIGLSISDAVMTFLNSGGVQNKEVCG